MQSSEVSTKVESTQLRTSTPYANVFTNPIDTIIKVRVAGKNSEVNENAPENVITEERGPNVDIIIKDTASKVNKATFRKLKLFVWKYLTRVTTQDARKKLGMELMGREVYGHKNHGQFMDYAKYYGKL
ncbi:hypothetical protein PPTG_23746 [Phytophthora nicotianae INRA-310]|uniref:RxLR effector protein n=1 Tax=Phytophthora nicotianae (strain INRA-310) TaxID=761204 RepID=W2PUV4_PHYN3|nr:hypothetical protein PPTG_23746 [Phytophthora nicotianae INRA-310]ETN03790.1 hypothetical protein PPTG_23746 [Phytophthora nicotianae INRA-310]